MGSTVALAERPSLAWDVADLVAQQLLVVPNPLAAWNSDTFWVSVWGIFCVPTSLVEAGHGTLNLWVEDLTHWPLACVSGSWSTRVGHSPLGR